jgi:hypothetical protein
LVNKNIFYEKSNAYDELDNRALTPRFRSTPLARRSMAKAKAKGPAPSRPKGSKGKGGVRRTKEKLGSHAVPAGAPKHFKAKKGVKKGKLGPLDKLASRL